MFHRHNPSLVLVIKSMIQGERGEEQAEEIAALVWSSLCTEGYPYLRRYNPRAGRLLGYLAYLARREIWRSRRAARSRHSRECMAARQESTWDEVGRGLVMQEFLATLTRREREFCVSDLLMQSKNACQKGVSPTNRWQLRCRVLKKFQTFFLQNY
jgi:hypothetical protein